MEYQTGCKFCPSPVVIKKGFTSTGYQQYQCPECKKYRSDSPYRSGRYPIEDEPTHKSKIAMKSRAKRKAERAKQQEQTKGFEVEVL